MTGTLNFVTNSVLVAQMVRLFLAPVVELPELMSSESCLLDFLAGARNGNGNLQRKTIGKCVQQHKGGILGAVGHCDEFDPVLVHRAKMVTSFRDPPLRRKGAVSFIMLFLCPMLRRRGAVSFAPDGSRSLRGPMTLLSCVLGGLPPWSLR